MRSVVIKDFFVCIGAQKTGTTWLARALRTHPDLFLTPVTEVHYFDHIRGMTEHLSRRKRRSRYRKYHQRLLTQWHHFGEHRSQWGWYRDYMRSPINDEWYASLFRHRGDKQFAGEVTPEYAIIGKEGFEHLRTLAPEVRVLFVMRNPVTRAWSQALHLCRSRGLDATRQPPEAMDALLGEPQLQLHGDYIATLDAMAAVFRPDQTLELFYEDIQKDRVGALEQVCRFIGMSSSARVFDRAGRGINQSQEAALPETVRTRLRETYKPLAQSVRQRIGRVPESWTREFGI
jgi:hypothetical protein